MILTQKYKFKKRELTDSPPDITATEDNWDKAESELDSQAKQIEDLSQHFYWGFSDVDSAFNANTPIIEIYNSMKDSSCLKCRVINGSNQYPRAYGTLEINKITDVYGYATFNFDKGNVRHTGDFRNPTTNICEFSGWEPIATTDKVDTLWDGNMTTGTTTLVKSASGYNCIIINYGTSTYTAYTLDRNPHKVIDGTYSIAVPDGKIVFTLTGTTMNITAATVPVRRIVGVLRGGIK